MPTFPARVPLPTYAPVPAIRPVGVPTTATPPPTLGSTGEALTLDALMARQKEAAMRQSSTMQEPVTNIAQGLGQLGWTLVNALQERRAEKGVAEGDAAIAEAFKQMDPVTGMLPPEAMQVLMQRDPRGLGVEMYKTAMAARAAGAKTDQWTQIPTPEGENGQWYQNQTGETKKVGGGTDTGAWKPSDIAARADDYTKAAATYDQAAPSWQSMQEAAVTALGAGGTEVGKGAADYNMIVGFAKLLDPNSVVHEGEVQSASNLGGYIDTVQGWLNQWKTNGGKLDDDVRKAIMQQGSSRMKAYYDQIKTKRDWISGVATRHGVDPNDVVPPLPDAFTPWEYKPPEPDPDKKPPKVDPATLPSIPKGDMDTFNALPAGAKYTVPGDVKADGTLTVYTKGGGAE